MDVIPKLTVLTEQHRGLIFELNGECHRIGRSEEAEITIPDATVSGFHCELVLNEAGGYTLVDEGQSTNGTRINGTLVSNQELVNADILQVGSVECMYECDSDTSTLETGTDHQIPLDENTIEVNRKTKNLAPEKLRDGNSSMGTHIKVVIWCLAVVGIGLLAWLILTLISPSGQ